MFISYFQHVIVAILMEFHIKLMDSEANTAAICCSDVPDTLSVFRIPVWITWAAEGAIGTRQVPTTTCRGYIPTLNVDEDSQSSRSW